MTPPELTNYFTAEKNGAWLLVVLAIVGFAFSAYLWFNRSAFLAMVWPLILVGLLVGAVGVGVGLRTPAQVAALERSLETARAETVAAEIKRMDRVNRNFRIVKIVEIALVAAGLLLIIFLPIPGTWSSVGMGLVLVASVVLVFDTFAHYRAEVYVKWLQSLGS
jgi:hypothetical protein